MTVLGGVAASLVFLAVSLATATTPEQARAQRAVPQLPPPTMVVAEGARAGAFAVPRGAIVVDEEGRTWVSVWTDPGSRRVEVREVQSDLPELVEVMAPELHVGDSVELVAADDAEAPPGRRSTRSVDE